MLSNCWGWLCPEFRSKRHVFHPFVSQVDKASKPMISVKVPGAVARKKKSPTFFCLNSIKSPFMLLNVYMFHSISRLYSETNMYKGYSWSYLVQRSPRGLYSCNEWENRPRNIAQPKTPLCKVSKMCVACVIFCNHCTFMLQMHSFWLMFTIVYILICEDLYRMYATPPDIDSCSPWFCLINQPFPWQVKGEDKVMAPEEVSSMVLTKMKAPSWVRLGRERERGTADHWRYCHMSLHPKVLEGPGSCHLLKFPPQCGHFESATMLLHEIELYDLIWTIKMSHREKKEHKWWNLVTHRMPPGPVKVSNSRDSISFWVCWVCSEFVLWVSFSTRRRRRTTWAKKWSMQSLLSPHISTMRNANPPKMLAPLQGWTCCLVHLGYTAIPSRLAKENRSFFHYFS